jgi:hypothetical protein
MTPLFKRCEKWIALRGLNVNARICGGTAKRSLVLCLPHFYVATAGCLPPRLWREVVAINVDRKYVEESRVRGWLYLSTSYTSTSCATFGTTFGTWDAFNDIDLVYTILLLDSPSRSQQTHPKVTTLHRTRKNREFPRDTRSKLFIIPLCNAIRKEFGLQALLAHCQKTELQKRKADSGAYSLSE